jgi:cytochrome c oxidase assembly protein subunit 15
LGRIIGLAFAIPFVFFAFKKVLSPALFKRCLLLLTLGGAQGFMGWYMVQSGLAELVSVSHFRLAAHLTLACIIFAAILYTVFQLSPNIERVSVPNNTKIFSIVLLVLVFMQIIWGAFVAGTHAGFIYNTWPLMDEQIIPKQLYSAAMTFYDFFHDHLPIQFTHRTLAYILLILVGIHAHKCRANSPRWLFSFVIGVLTLINVTPLGLALLHQGFALVVILFATLNVYMLVGDGSIVKQSQ